MTLTPIEQKPLKEISEADILQLVQSGRSEGPTLEYKSDLYGSSDKDKSEFLKDVCMFANAHGGDLLIGVPELRGPSGNTGIPDPTGTIGVLTENPEAVLSAYESRILDCIDDRIKVNSVSIPMSDGRQVLLIRVPDSMLKPHRVVYQGRVSFPSRRERQRYELNAGEIKELAMSVASQGDRAEQKLAAIILEEVRLPENPLLTAAVVPLGSKNFLVDLSAADTTVAVASYQFFWGAHHPTDPYPTANGLTKSGPQGSTLTLRHDGTLRLRAPLRAQVGLINSENWASFYPTAIDHWLRPFLHGAGAILQSLEIAGAVLFGAGVSSAHPFHYIYSELTQGFLREKTLSFPSLAIPSLDFDVDRTLLPLCDYIHQVFGQPCSPRFSREGRWIPPGP